MAGERSYGEAIKDARGRLHLSLAELQKRMAALGYKISVQRLEQLEYDQRGLNVRGQLRLRQIAETLRGAARELGWGAEQIAAQLSDAALFPGYLSETGIAAKWATPGAAESPAALVNATILFIDLMNSVALSTALSLWEYNELITDYQAVLREVLDSISASYPVGEYYLGGDQLAVFFYDSDDAAVRAEVDELRREVSRGGGVPAREADRAALTARLAELEAQLSSHRDRALYGALRCAVAVKNAWIAHPRNVLRVATDQPVLDVGIGINTGNVVLQQRGDGSRRIEGFAINFAKRVEGFSRHGRYCRIMLSRTAYETFRGIVVENTMLKQRAFFQTYTPSEGTLKGLAPGTEVFELKFFHRLAGFAIPVEQIRLHRDIFENDPTNIWAYTNLLNHHLYRLGELEVAQEIAQKALYCNPGNEKIYYDLSVIHQQRGELDLAREYALQCLRLNDQMDIAWQLLAELDMARGAGADEIVSYINRALAQSPHSADLHLMLALQLAGAARRDEAQKHFDRAREIFPGLEARFAHEAAQFAQLMGSSPLK
jgi:class 3 adenylate cyclase